MPFFGGIVGDAGCCGGVGDAAASVSVGEGIFSDLVYRRGLLAGWWLVMRTSRWPGHSSSWHRNAPVTDAKHVLQSECIFSPF